MDAENTICSHNKYCHVTCCKHCKCCASISCVTEDIFFCTLCNCCCCTRERIQEDGEKGLQVRAHPHAFIKPCRECKQFLDTICNNQYSICHKPRSKNKHNLCEECYNAICRCFVCHTINENITDSVIRFGQYGEHNKNFCEKCIRDAVNDHVSCWEIIRKLTPYMCNLRRNDVLLITFNGNFWLQNFLEIIYREFNENMV